MTWTTASRTPDRPEWVVLANAARARLLERDPETGALREFESFVHPASRLGGHELADDRPGQAFKGQARTAFQPRQTPHEKEEAAFAHELAKRLDAAAMALQFGRLVLLASNPFLGRLHAALGPAARQLVAAAAVDLTGYADRELEERVTAALAAAAEPAQG